MTEIAKSTMIKDNFLNGLIIGLIIPIVGFGLLWFINNGLMKANAFGSSTLEWAGFKTSTLVLMAICINLIPVLYANRKRMEEFIRGIMFPTVIGSFVWFFYFDPLQLY
jgi:hypothetical protein